MNRLAKSKSLTRLISVLAVMAALAIFAPAIVALAGEMDANAKALAKLDDDWSKAAGTRDAEKVAAFYADDAVVYPPGEPVVLGKAAAKKVWVSYFSVPTFSISWKTTHAEVAKGGDLGFTSGTYETSLKVPDGKNVIKTGKYLCIWKKEADGSWKAIHDMWNEDAN